jgi:hypothetical protein
MGFQLGSVARILGLKSETWGTHRLFPMMGRVAREDRRSWNGSVHDPAAVDVEGLAGHGVA